MSSSCPAEAIRERVNLAAQEPPLAEGRVQRVGVGARPSERGVAGPPGGRGHSSPSPWAGAVGEAEDGNTLLRR